MAFILQPWQSYVVILAGWIDRQQQDVIDYLVTENQVLKGKFGKKRIMLSDDQRRRLAINGRILGRKRLEEVGTLFTPDTILRWQRMKPQTSTTAMNDSPSRRRSRVNFVKYSWHFSGRVDTCRDWRTSPTSLRSEIVSWLACWSIPGYNIVVILLSSKG